MDLIKKLITLIISLSVELSMLNAQNLIPNGNFETHKHFFSFRTLEDLSLWSKANQTTPDYIKSEFYFRGRQIAHSGIGYVGILLNKDTLIFSDYVEYVSIALKEPLLKGRKYCLSIHSSLADNDFYAVSEINYSFTAKKISNKELILSQWITMGD